MIVVADRLPGRRRARRRRWPSTSTSSATCAPQVDDGEVTARLALAAAASARWRWRGDIPADGCERVGTIQIVVPDAPGALVLDARAAVGDGEVDNRYEATIIAR